MFESELIKTDITSVKLINKYVLAGIGNFLHVHDQNGNFIKKVQIFDGQQIHGIEVDDDERRILLYGGRYMQTLECDFNNVKLVHLQNKQINDWILTARCLKSNLIAVVVMNNNLRIYSQDFAMVQHNICKEKCILYSALICYNHHLEELVILSGTVFGEILIWKVACLQDANTCSVLIKLKGHNGVIFSVNYNENAGYICSSSDDRSTILWSIENKCIHKELKHAVPNISLKQKFYGHQSRIFRSVIVDNGTLITAGEDSYVNIWNFQGELLRKIATHQGGPVWALDYKNNLIVSGGGGCGVLISSLTCKTVCQRLVLPENQIPKRIGFLRSNNVVVVTEPGALYYHVHARGEWLKIGQHEDLKSYSLLELSKCRNLVSLSGYRGEIYIYQEQKDMIELLVAFKTDRGCRICSFHWLTCKTFLTCEEGGILSLWYLLSNQIVFIASFDLPERKKEVCTTAACQGENGKYIVGDRRGNIHVYELKTKLPIQTFKRAHNHLGITQLQNFGSRIVSLGRDGTVKTFLLSGKIIQLISTDKVPFTWLAGLVDHLVLAFCGNTFLLWDYKMRRTLLEHVCGGGHRSWDFQKRNNTITFGYVKDRTINVIECDEKQFRSVNVIPGYHTNTINSIRIIEFNNQYVLLSGSDDTNLRISILGRNHFLSLKSFKPHLSSIRTVCIHQLSQQEYLMFSGGGRGQIICWKFYLSNDLESSECTQQYSHYEQMNEQLSESEIRIMDMELVQLEDRMVLFAATSNGNVNCFRVNLESNGKYKMRLITSLFYKTKCVSKIAVVKGLSILIAASTDGTCTFWNLSQLEVGMIPFKIMTVHQSGIADCCFRFVTNDLVLFLSGGDDGCVALSLLQIEEDRSFVCVQQFRDVTSHCAQITGTWIGTDYFLTTSIDQKLLLFKWNVDENNHKLCCKLLTEYNSALPDIQGLECLEDHNYFHIFLYGKGVEYVKFIKKK